MATTSAGSTSLAWVVHSLNWYDYHAKGGKGPDVRVYQKPRTILLPPDKVFDAAYGPNAPFWAASRVLERRYG